MICCVCNREREQGSTIKLTSDEKRILAKTMTDPVPDNFFYCAACWAIISDRSQGAQLFKGLLQAGMSRLGVRRANVVAERYYRFLVDKAKKPLS